MKVEIFKVLSCQTRFEMMMMLINNEHVCVCHLEQNLNLSQANASKHMRMFREVNIVETRKEGKSVYYKLTTKFKQENLKLIEYLKEGNYDYENCCIC